MGSFIKTRIRETGFDPGYLCVVCGGNGCTSFMDSRLGPTCKPMKKVIAKWKRLGWTGDKNHMLCPECSKKGV